MITVLHVAEPVALGIRRHLIDVVRHTPDVDHQIALPPRMVTGAAESTGAALRDAGAQLHLVDLRHSPFHPAVVGSVVSLRGLIRDLAPEIVHAHSSVAGAVARSCASSGSGPSVYTPHGLAAGRPAHLVERVLGRWRTDCLVALSPSEASQALELGLVPPDRLRVIPNGIDLQVPSGPGVDVRARLGLTPGTPLVGCVARLVRQKAPEQFVRTCAIVARHRPGAHFVLVGEGRLQQLVNDEVRASGLGNRFHQIERLPDAQAAGMLGQLDVFVLASRFEGGPYAPLEAMRAGVPVVLSDVVGNRDVVENGVSGFLVPFGDARAAAAAVARLLEDEALRSSAVAAARERLRDIFDVRKMGESLRQLYQELAPRQLRRAGESLQVQGGPADALTAASSSGCRPA